MHGCMVFTEHAPRQQQFLYGTSHVTTNQCCNLFSGSFKKTLCKATVTHSELHMTRTQQVCSETENSAIISTVKHLGLNSR